MYFAVCPIELYGFIFLSRRYISHEWGFFLSPAAYISMYLHGVFFFYQSFIFAQKKIEGKFDDTNLKCVRMAYKLLPCDA